MIDLERMLYGPERIDVEVKAARKGVPETIWETYSSFANTFGGTIVLGVSEDSETRKFIPCGVQNADKMLSDIWNALNSHEKISANILLEHQVYKAEYEGLEFVVIEVPRADRRDKPVYVGHDMFKDSFKRNHEGDYHCSKEEVKAMLRDQSDTSPDSLVLDKLGIDSLNAQSIKDYRARFRSIRENHMWNNLPNEDFLIKIGAARISEHDGKVHPTLAGLIFFGEYMSIVNELPDYFLDYRERMSNDTRWSDRVCASDGDWSGNVYDFYFRIIDRLTSDVKRPFQLDNNMLRIDDTSVHKALRECLANALIHADYYGRRGIVIDKEFRRIVISNPGTFRVDIEEAIAGGISDARNVRIFNMFSLINVGECSGIGLCDVFSTWKENGYKEPVIIESVNPDRVTFTLEVNNDGNHEVNDGNHEVNDGNHEVNDGNHEVNDGNHEDLSKTEFDIYSFIKENNGLSAKMIAAALGISTATVERATKKLKMLGYIKRSGATRGSWSILR